jgi:Acyl-CoA reductase (LuxC)
MSATVEQVQEAIARTVEAHERVVQHRNTDAIIEAIAETANRWREPKNSWRLRAIEQAPTATGFSEPMVREAIDLTFGALTHEALGELIDRELGNRRILDEFCLRGRLRSRAIGPQLIAHFLAGNVPPPGIISICCGLLLKSANLVKVSNRDPIFPTLFAESLRDVDAELADCVAVFDWTREDSTLTHAALVKANAIVAYGDDQTISALRQLAPEGSAFLGYGHKISLAVVAKEAMTEENLPKLVEAAAFDASVYDQQGCLSPHVFYVEERGELGARKFAAALADAMAAYQRRVPRGTLSIEEAGAFTQVRTRYEFRTPSDRRVAVWSSPNPNEWCVVYDNDTSFTPSCLNRMVFVKPTDGLKRVLDSIQRFAPKLSTVGVAPMTERTMAFAASLSNMGVHRLCPIGQMQRPPLSWHHDGHPNLADLVTWTDLG